MQAMGVNAMRDQVYPDLAFSLPTPPDGTGPPGAVGVGVMDYSGGNEDRPQASAIHVTYVDKMKQFVRWLVDNGRPVRLLIGDWDDEPVAREILADLRASRPEIDSSQVSFEPVSSLDDVMRQMASVDIVVAMRFHNVICSLRMAKPTLAIGYARKHDALMADMGVPEFCEHVKSLDFPRLAERFIELEARAAQVREVLAKRNAVQAQLLDDQFARLSEFLLGSGQPDSCISHVCPDVIA
jgi:polysaccharide pyruvyl transferase WcaK-like protein